MDKPNLSIPEFTHIPTVTIWTSGKHLALILSKGFPPDHIEVTVFFKAEDQKEERTIV